ncbi:hypothetical protein AC1031_021705 [Aphanomyces cochlioides]|nr:hypothetical protein AC1031_021705 [Aphanomyces cochlioides]
MPWTAVPYASRNIHAALKEQFRPEGTPTFILFDENGQVICKNARDKVEKDPAGANFPYHPKTLPEILGNKFLQGEHGTLSADALRSKNLGLYFAASWSKA